MRTVVVIGATEPLGLAALQVISAHRAEFIVDGLADSGADPRRLAELVTEFTPLRLGVTDEYAVGAVAAELDDIRLDAGLVEWEVAPVEILGGAEVISELVTMPFDIAIIGLAGEDGRAAAELATANGARLVLLADELSDAEPATVAKLLEVEPL